MKTTIDVDRKAADSAARILGTGSLRETVNAALREVVSAANRRRLADRIRRGELRVPTPEELARIREPEIEVGSLSKPSKRTR
jgi:Arc/MetJ family transcription regulator